MAYNYIDIRVEGADEFHKKLEMAIKYAPDITKKTIQKCGNELKKETVRQMDASGVRNITGNLRKGMKFRMDERTYRADASGKFIGETRQNPHFHLIENGHDVVPRGKTKHRNGDSKERVRERSTAGKGRSGYHMMQNAINIYTPKHREYAEEAMDKLLKKVGLT